MSGTQMNTLTRLFILALGVSTIPLLIYSILHTRLDSLTTLLFWTILAIASDFKPFVRLKVGAETNLLTMSSIVYLCLILLLTPAEAALVSIIATTVTEAFTKKQFHKIFFNVAQIGVSVFISCAVFHMLKLSIRSVQFDILSDLPALLVSISVFWVLNTFFVSAVISLASRSSFLSIFLSDYRTLLSYYYTSAPISVATALFYDPARPYITLIMIPPVVMIYNALQKYFNLHEQTYETIKVLAKTIDERDEYTSAHSTRVAEYAKKIAENLQLPLNTIQDIELAGQVHDLGKISIEDKILKKPGKLTQKEFNKICEHPATAYKLLNNLKPYKNGAEYVLYHHERYDGSGYPDGIAGKIIPLGARILAVADSYDAMTSDRPYRKALTPAQAVEELRRNSGTQFDPQVVDAFVEIMKAESEHKEEVQACS